MNATILIVDDEESILKTLGGILEDEGYRTVTASDGLEALAVAQQEMPDLAMLDIWMPRMEGLETLQRLKELFPDLTVIMMSGHGTIETAVKSTKMGAYDFVEKPLSLEKVIVTVQNALDLHRLRQENASLRRRMLQNYDIVGKSPTIQKLQEQARMVAAATTSVLITGENGTGKELFAGAIHMHSSRRDKPFVEVNCAAIPEELMDYELFGHEKGVFSGADAQKKGRVDLADGGTLFLEEVADLSLKSQAKVLRLLEERKFDRPGGTRTVEVDVRVVASSSKRLEEEVNRGSFREDLFYLLNVVALHIPPLRDRKDDIPVLIDHFLGKFCRLEGRTAKVMAPEAVQAMKRYDWMGNVRELKNIVERLVIMTPGYSISTGHLPEYITAAGGDEPSWRPESTRDSLRVAREEFEREFIIQKLEENNWDIGATADVIELERSNLQRKIKAYRINISKLT